MIRILQYALRVCMIYQYHVLVGHLHQALDQMDYAVYLAQNFSQCAGGAQIRPGVAQCSRIGDSE